MRLWPLPTGKIGSRSWRLRHRWFYKVVWTGKWLNDPARGRVRHLSGNQWGRGSTQTYWDLPFVTFARQRVRGGKVLSGPPGTESHRLGQLGVTEEEYKQWERRDLVMLCILVPLAIVAVLLIGSV